MSLIKVNLPSKVAMDGVYIPREVISAIKEKDSRFAAMVIEQAKNATSIEQVKKFLKDKTNGIYSRAAQWGLTEWNKVEHSAAQDGEHDNFFEAWKRIGMSLRNISGDEVILLSSLNNIPKNDAAYISLKNAAEKLTDKIEDAFKTFQNLGSSIRKFY